MRFRFPWQKDQYSNLERCLFCCRIRPEANPFEGVAGANGFICRDCIEICAHSVASQGPERRAQRNFQEGDVYFEVTYPDIEMCYPNIQTYVFSGMSNAEDGSGVWCFQYVESFAKYGSALTNAGGDRIVILKSEGELTEILDFVGLQSVLTDASKRRSMKARE